MQLDEVDVLDEIDGGIAGALRGNDRRGLCSLGEALHELLANYPVAVELDEASPDEDGASPVSYSDVTQIGIAGLAEMPDLEVIGLDPSQISVAVVEKLPRKPSLKIVTIDRQRALWVKQYRGARDFDNS